MDYQKLSEFRYLRDMSIILIARENNIPIQSIIQMDKHQVPKFSSDQALEFFQEYFAIRKSLFSESTLLFPTDEGRLFLPNKFKQNFKRMLSCAEITATIQNPFQLTNAQMEKLVALKFVYQRPIFQAYLAAALLGYQAMRPNEVAKLRKSDILLSEETIILRDTKSREDQPIIIYPNLIEPLRNYLRHIGPDEPLFIRESNQQWERRDVYHAIKSLGKHHGFENINPRRFRSTVANYMINSGIPIKFVSRYLRHKDVATTLRHYMEVAGHNETRLASKFLHALLSGQATSFHEFASNQTLN